MKLQLVSKLLFRQFCRFFHFQKEFVDRLGKLPSKEQQLSRTQHFILRAHAAIFVLHIQYGPRGTPLTPMIQRQNCLLSTNLSDGHGPYQTSFHFSYIDFSCNRRLPLSGRLYFTKPLVQSVSTLLGWGAGAGLLPQYSCPCYRRIPRKSWTSKRRCLSWTRTV